MISTVIAKPTKECNADCSYCSSPPDNQGYWSVDQFRIMWDRLKDRLTDECSWIWHGGEPMLLSPDFYRECYKIAIKDKPDIKFAMQTNLLLYKSTRWKDLFENEFGSRVSTSFDPDEVNRTIKGSASKYSKAFYSKLNEVLHDGFRPMVIGTYTDSSAHLTHKMYELSKSYGDRAFTVRYNYRYPAGREANSEVKDIMSPKVYGEMLIDIYNRWIKETPAFVITPLDQMFKGAIDATYSVQQCPWTADCGGRFLSIQPNGDLYNCSEFADLDNENYRFGNIFNGTIDDEKSKKVVNFYNTVDDEKFIDGALNTPAARLMKRRSFDLPEDCKTCRHFHACHGGCMRDSLLYDRGLGGKFYYCQSWKMTFDRIKESVMTGEADNALIKYGKNPEKVRMFVSGHLTDNLC